MAEDEQKKDGRMDWIAARLGAAMPHLKAEKLAKALAGKDAVGIVEEFVDGDAPMLLVNGGQRDTDDRAPRAPAQSQVGVHPQEGHARGAAGRKHRRRRHGGGRWRRIRCSTSS